MNNGVINQKEKSICVNVFPMISSCAVLLTASLCVFIRCIQNYNRAPMMALAVPVAVRFLRQGNRELSRNMSSYLSLAAIAKAELLVQHTQAIIISVLGGRGQVKGCRGHARPPTEHLQAMHVRKIIPNTKADSSFRCRDAPNTY